jgi:hypothetical protein
VAGAPTQFDSEYAHMSVTRQNQNKLNSFQEVSVVQDGNLLIYDGDLQQTVNVVNDDKGTLYHIKDGECSCRGYQFHNQCKHLDGLEQVRQFLGDQL